MVRNGIACGCPCSVQLIWRRTSAAIFPTLTQWPVILQRWLLIQQIEMNIPKISYKSSLEFFSNVKIIRLNYHGHAIHFYAYSLFFLVLGIVTLDTRLGSLEKDLTAESRPMKLLKAAIDTNSQILKTDNGLQLWRNRWKIKTPAYKKLCNSQEYIEQ